MPKPKYSPKQIYMIKKSIDERREERLKALEEAVKTISRRLYDVELKTLNA